MHHEAVLTGIVPFVCFLLCFVEPLKPFSVTKMPLYVSARYHKIVCRLQPLFEEFAQKEPKFLAPVSL